MTGPARPGYYHGIDLLRILAMTAVVYTHVASWFATRGRTWPVSDVVDTVLIGPLHLNPNLSFVGVSGFLLISGVVITHVALRETPGGFLARRAVRILPPMIVVLVVVWVLRRTALRRPDEAPPDLLDLLGNVTFAVFFHDLDAVLLGVAWTLLVQVGFYCYVAATIPLLRRYPWLPPLLACATLSVVLALVPSVDVPSQRIGIIVGYLPVLLIGQVIALVRIGRLTATAGTALGALSLLLFTGADLLGPYTGTGGAHSRTLLLVALVVLLGMGAGNRVTKSPVVGALAKRTYAVFLVHETCVYPLMDALVPRIGPAPALALALAVVLVAAEVLYRGVERPVTGLLRRRLTRAADSRPAPR